MPPEVLQSSQNDVDLSHLNGILSGFGQETPAVIPLLQKAQAQYGYLPVPVLEALSHRTGIPLSQLYGVATFYAQFRLKPVGKHMIRVCHGTACHVSGAERVTECVCDHLDAKTGETTADGQWTIESVACLGCCSLAPVMMIDGETFGRLDEKGVITAIKEIKGHDGGDA